MVIYINSRGYSRQDPNHEYAWRVASLEATLDATTILGMPRFQQHSIGGLIEPDSRRPSLVLARSGGSLYLLVTRMKSRRRTGSQGESLFSAILIETGESDLTVLRGLAADVLNSSSPFEAEADELLVGDCGVCAGAEETRADADAAGEPCVLEECLDEAVEFHAVSGFQVNRAFPLEEELRRRVEDRAIVAPRDQHGFRWIAKHGRNSQALRRDLSHQLCNPAFPRSEGPLVVVTGALTVKTLVESGCWRGLIRLSEARTWERTPVHWRLQTEKEQQEQMREGRPPGWWKAAATVLLGRRD